MAGAAAIRMAAGHAIAFEPTNTCRLAYDSITNTLRWNQGALSYAVGKGITVGWETVYASSATLPNYMSGNIVFLTGGSPYTITLPATNSVAAGTGFTFSVLGLANVNIAVTGGDTIDNGPVTLRPNDRYHDLARSVSDECGEPALFRSSRAPVVHGVDTAQLTGLRSESLYQQWPQTE
jgi:hypothetical protein